MLMKSNAQEIRTKLARFVFQMSERARRQNS